VAQIDRFAPRFPVRPCPFAPAGSPLPVRPSISGSPLPVRPSISIFRSPLPVRPCPFAPAGSPLPVRPSISGSPLPVRPSISGSPLPFAPRFRFSVRPSISVRAYSRVFLQERFSLLMRGERAGANRDEKSIRPCRSPLKMTGSPLNRGANRLKNEVPRRFAPQIEGRTDSKRGSGVVQYRPTFNDEVTQSPGMLVVILPSN
jgi:hypothetical protein